MRRRIAEFGLRSLLAMVAIACATSATVPTPTGYAGTPPAGANQSPSAADVVNDAADGISFVRPASWSRSVPNAHDPDNDGPLIYLSTEPLLAACAAPVGSSPNPADSRGLACEWPLHELGSDGVLVTWLTTRILVPLPSAGEPIDVNQASARMERTAPGTCGAIGGDETLYVAVPIGQPKPWTNVAVLACLRGPDLAAAEAEVLAMLESARVAQ